MTGDAYSMCGGVTSVSITGINARDISVVLAHGRSAPDAYRHGVF